QLVTQTSIDGHGSSVVEGGAQTIAQAISRGWSRARELPPVQEGETPFPLPTDWVWARLSEVTHGLGQKVPDSDFTYIEVGSVDGFRGVLKPHPSVITARDAPSRARKIIEPGAVLYSTIRPYLRNVVHLERQLNPPPIASTAFAVLKPVAGLDPRYLWICL